MKNKVFIDNGVSYLYWFSDFLPHDENMLFNNITVVLNQMPPVFVDISDCVF